MNGGLSGTFAALLVLGALILWWLSAVQARERARGFARGFCRRQGWQLLDQTVSLISFRPRRNASGWDLVRRYRFEFSPDGGRRSHGELMLIGGRLGRIVARTDDGNLIEENAP